MAERRSLDLSREDYIPDTLAVNEAERLYQGARIAMLVTAEDLHRRPSHGIVVAVGEENVRMLFSKYDPPGNMYYYVFNCSLLFPRSRSVMRRALGQRVMLDLSLNPERFLT